MSTIHSAVLTIHFLYTDLIIHYSLEKEYGSTSWLELVKPRNIIRVHCAIFTHLWSQFSGKNIPSIVYFLLSERAVLLLFHSSTKTRGS